jgi:type I restriction enzyme S subunit
MALLSDIVDINPESVTRTYPHSKIEYIDISSVHTGSYEGTKTLTLKDAPSRAKRIVSDGDTILSTVRPNLRAFLYIKKPAVNTIASTGFAVLRAKPNKLDGRYLYYAVTSQYFTDYLTLNAKGSAYPAVDAGIIGRAEIYLPGLPVQEKISSVLGCYDDLIENNSKRIEKLETMSRLLYLHYFDAPEAIDRVVKIGGAFNIVGGGTPSKNNETLWINGDINWYTPSNLTKSGSMFIEESSDKINQTGLKKSSAKLFDSYSIMMTSRATIGVISINTTTAATNQGFITCLPNEETGLYYLYYWLKANTDQIERKASGTTFKEISKGVFKTIDFPVPKQTTLKQFELKVKPFSELILILQRKNKSLSNARDLLLPRLLSGEIKL